MADIELSVSIAGLLDGGASPWSGSPRAMLGWVGSLGVRRIQLDAARAGMRPRELDRSARRDLAATLRRLELMPGGLDLWIPPEHFVDAARQDRAVAAVLAAIELAGELASISGSGIAVLSMALHAETPPVVLSTLGAAARRTGVEIADHGWPVRDGGPVADPLAIGLDVASVFAAGEDPIERVGSLGDRLRVLRLSDLDGSGRVPAGRGRLDVTLLRATLTASADGARPIVDLRGLRDQAAGAAASIEAWNRASIE